MVNQPEIHEYSHKPIIDSFRCKLLNSSILQLLDWPTLHEGRDQMKLIMMYKIIHGLIYIQHNLPLTYSNLNNRPVARDFERGVLFDQKWTFSKGPNIVTVLLEWLTALLEYLDLALHLIHAINELLEALNLVSY